MTSRNSGHHKGCFFLIKRLFCSLNFLILFFEKKNLIVNPCMAALFNLQKISKFNPQTAPCYLLLLETKILFFVLFWLLFCFCVKKKIYINKPIFFFLSETDKRTGKLASFICKKKKQENMKIKNYFFLNN